MVALVRMHACMYSQWVVKQATQCVIAGHKCLGCRVRLTQYALIALACLGLLQARGKGSVRWLSLFGCMPALCDRVR